jgi:hypothetical protein
MREICRWYVVMNWPSCDQVRLYRAGKLASTSLKSKLQELLGTALCKSIFVPRMHLFTWVPRSQLTGRVTASVFIMYRTVCGMDFLNSFKALLCLYIQPALDTQKFCILPTECMVLIFMNLRTKIIFVYSINWPFLINGIKHVYCAIQT